MTDGPVLFAHDGDIGTVTLNRPNAGNALDRASAEALLDIAIRCDLDPAIRCVVVRGAGKLFCGGGDIAGFQEAGDDIGAYLSKLAGVLHMAIARLMRMPKPMLVAVHGPAPGAGMSLALAGDSVIVSRSASFSTAYGSIGLSPDGGMSWLLPRLVGMRRAQDLLLTSRKVNAEEAVTLGLATRLVDDDAFDREVDAMARKLADRPVNAFARTKSLLLDSTTDCLEGQLEREIRMLTQSGLDAESREGLAAFTDKRKPQFKGAR